MPTPYRHVSLSDRRTIFRMMHEKRPIAQIADAIGRHRSTVYREIGRNKVQPEPDNRPFRYFEHHRSEGYYPVVLVQGSRSGPRRVDRVASGDAVQIS